MSGAREVDVAHYAARAAAHGIPDYMIAGLVRWIVLRVTPVSFLQAVIANDLRKSCECADEVNQKLLWNYCTFLYDDAPGPCWGSPEKAASWRGAGP